MESIKHYIQIALDKNILWECMEWDEKHGPTEGQIAAFNLLFPDMKANYDALHPNCEECHQPI